MCSGGPEVRRRPAEVHPALPKPCTAPLRASAHRRCHALRGPLQHGVQVAHAAHARPPGHAIAQLLRAQHLGQQHAAQARGGVRQAALACARGAPVSAPQPAAPPCARAARRPAAGPATGCGLGVAGAGRPADPPRQRRRVQARERPAGAPAGPARAGTGGHVGGAPRTGLPPPQAAQQQRGHALDQQDAQPLPDLRRERVCGVRLQAGEHEHRVIDAVGRRRERLRVGAACGAGARPCTRACARCDARSAAPGPRTAASGQPLRHDDHQEVACGRAAEGLQVGGGVPLAGRAQLLVQPRRVGQELRRGGSLSVGRSAQRARGAGRATGRTWQLARRILSRIPAPGGSGDSGRYCHRSPGTLLSQRSTADMLAWNCAKRADRGVPASPHASDSAHTLQGTTACAARSPPRAACAARPAAGRARQDAPAAAGVRR